MKVLLGIGTRRRRALAGTGPQRAFGISPNNLGGGVLYFQAHALDACQPAPIPVANPHGGTVTMVMSNTSKLVQVSRIFGNTAGTTKLRRRRCSSATTTSATAW